MLTHCSADDVFSVYIVGTVHQWIDSY